MYLNKAFVIGNLTRDPERRALPSGTTVVNFAVATTRYWKDKNGVRQEDTQFHNCVAFGAQAETIAQYMRKGSSIMIEGRMQTRSWDAQDGSKKYRTEIIVDSFQFGPKREGGSSFDTGSPAPAGKPESASVPPSELETIQYPEEEINPDDIPF
ncbi:MAG TPA: single-stranded DNA-binding protein [Candidatus Paceibacterota bacterium]|jgi:single-strand DNA-binding protein|nr:single-stranded DNA-binding protein [Candidatus Paceibacterota bacterium]HPI24445.1 single-stranded DNA-binding protein [Candidatus Paceibacterota bacterium]HPN89688.1 single-stranded DNA-binding protein [Candidatus Paceibacterota bacterium]